jgi:D-arabinose 1-dehydrogenase-like Zn-dependent alcohol dehydrogenase
VPKPADLSWEEAACVPTAWLTAYRMLFTQAGLRPGDTVLVQGAGGGVATALIRLGSAAGLRVWATSRDEAKQARALELGAEQVFPSGARLPHRVDAVMDSVGAATWSHSLKALRPGGTVVICGATSGPNPAATELNRIFYLQLRVVGSAMGTRGELEQLLSLCELTGVRPVIDTVLPLEQARDGFARMEAGVSVPSACASDMAAGENAGRVLHGPGHRGARAAQGRGGGDPGVGRRALAGVRRPQPRVRDARRAPGNVAGPAGRRRVRPSTRRPGGAR